MQPTNPNLLESVPRDGLMAIDRMLAAMAQGQASVDELSYEANGVCCPIGFLLTREQRLQIAEAGLNSSPLHLVAQKFGQANIEAMTGMQLSLVQRLQRELDAQFTNDDAKELLVAFRAENRRALSRSNPGLLGAAGKKHADQNDEEAVDPL